MNATWIIKSPNNKTTPLEAEVLSCNRKELMPRGLKRMAKFWGIALACVVVPVLHFILVPGFFILGIYFGSETLKLKYKIIDGTFTCPDCNKTNCLKDLWFKETQAPICQECGVQVILTRS